jgi:hypothetical protein
VDGKKLQRRDAIGVSEVKDLTIHAVSTADLLAIEVPMFA